MSPHNLLIIYLLTYLFITTEHHSKILPKEEIEIKVIDFAWLIINLKNHVICFIPY